jgi:hypothetical protein
MQRLTWLFVAASASAACGTSSGAQNHGPQGDPIGFTFENAEGGFADFGWSGALHLVKGAAGTPFGVKTTQCDDSGVCRFEGPSDPASGVKRRRCLFRTSMLCQTDADCGADYQPCVYIYDAPIATPLTGADGSVGACGWSYIPLTTPDGKPSITGTLNLDTGALNLENLTVLLPLNARRDAMGRPGFAGVCPECVGDVSPNDGKKDGVCRVSTRLPNPSVHADPGLDEGMPCDVHRSGTLPGYEGSYSMDCAVPLQRGIGQPTQFGGSFSSEGFRAVITRDSPDCTTPGFAGEKCFCAMCADGVTPCMSSADCGGQTCGAPSLADCDANPYPGQTGYDATFPVNQCRRSPLPSRFGVGGDGCDAAGCRWDATTNIGSCHSALDGRPIGCYPSGLGNSIQVNGRAERDPGVSTIYYADTATARCMPAGQSAALNSQLGLPGLTFQKRNFRIISRYGEAP